jgi:hypothetical protein
MVMTAPRPIPNVILLTATGRGHRGGVVGLFLIERNYAEQIDPDLLDHEGVKLVNDDVGVRWIYSFLSADRKKSYCLYEAPSPEAIRDAAQRAGLPADVIVEVDQYRPPTSPG